MKQFGGRYRSVDETLSGAAMPWHGRTIEEDDHADILRREFSIDRGYPFF